MRSTGCFGAAVLQLILAAVQAGAAGALPQGKAWTPVESLGLPGFDYLASPLIDSDSTGSPLLTGNGRSFTGESDALGFRWAESGWVISWRLGRGTGHILPVLAPRNRQVLIWRELKGAVETRRALVLAEVIGEDLVVADTITDISDLSNFYTADVTAKRSWVVTDDEFGGRLFYSDVPHVWHETFAPIGATYSGVSVAALDDTSALVAWATPGGAAWGVAGAHSWVRGQDTLSTPGSNLPELRPRPSGGHWLAWGSYGQYLQLSFYKDGQWSPPDTLASLFQNPAAILRTNAPDFSRDGSEYPALAWGIYDGDANLERVCVSQWTDAGFGAGEVLAGSEGNELPRIARDRNGDLWVAWWRRYDGTFWTHTYTQATASDLTLTGTPGSLTLSWVLSEPAPDTWWAILRARGGGAFEAVARVKAGAELGMSWTDEGPPSVLLRYRVRRESVDSRYQWESEEVESWPKSFAMPLRLQGSDPVRRELRAGLSGAGAGALDVRIYDIQGRLASRRQMKASGTGRDSIALDLDAGPRPLGPGVYFMKVVDSAGRVSETLRFVRLR